MRARSAARRAMRSQGSGTSFMICSLVRFLFSGKDEEVLPSARLRAASACAEKSEEGTHERAIEQPQRACVDRSTEQHLNP